MAFVRQACNSVITALLIEVRSQLTGWVIFLPQALFVTIARQRGRLSIPNLTAERSINVSGGVTAAIMNHIRLTVDAYWIQIKNRIVLSGRFDTTNVQVRDILRPYP